MMHWTPLIEQNKTAGLLSLASPAKVNLFLHIVGRRDDGYHRLVTLIAKVNCFDTITFRRRSDATLQLSCPNFPELEDDDNLILRAARQILPKGCGVDVVLDKRIPMGAGLGGGSGNAATTLVALNTLFDLALPTSQLYALGAKLGADVPLFLDPAPYLLATDTGTMIEPLLERPTLDLVLVHPGFGVATAWAYKAYREQSEQKMSPNSLTLSSRNDKEIAHKLGKVSNSSWFSYLTSELHNDLEPVVMKHHPEIGQLKQRLLDEGALGTLMSGSGSSVFGLFANAAAAEVVVERLTKSTGLWCQAVRTL